MWEKLARKLLKNRWIILPILVVGTIFMGIQMQKIGLSYVYAKLVPQPDPVYQNNLRFIKLFGEDANVLTLGVESDKIFERNFFNDWYRLGNDIKAINGVNVKITEKDSIYSDTVLTNQEPFIQLREKKFNIYPPIDSFVDIPIQDVLSIAHLYNMYRNDSTQNMEFHPIINGPVTTDEAMDSIEQLIRSLKFYDGLILNQESMVSAMALTMNPVVLNSKSRVIVVDQIEAFIKAFEAKHNVEIHKSGLPFIRTVVSNKVKNELIWFVALAMSTTAILLFIMFRSLYMVVFPLIVVAFGVIWSLGLVGLFGYKITILTGLIPPLIIVIGIPNCIYLLNRYHSEFTKHGNKMKALTRVIEKVGVATLFTNLTTAIGFGVFFFTGGSTYLLKELGLWHYVTNMLSGTSILKEFGLIAGLSIMTTFVVSLLIIPIIFSFLPEPTKKQTKYLDNRVMENFLEFIAKRILGARKIIFAATLVIISVAFFGMLKMKSETFVVDDIPHESSEYKDLKFFEKHFAGIMPLEIVIDSRKEGKFKGSTAYNPMKRMDKAAKAIANHESFSNVLSIAEGFKFVTQAYYRGNPKSYRVPQSSEAKRIGKYLEGDEESSKGAELLANFVDTTGRYARMSVRVADIGSERLPQLVDSLQVQLSKIFGSRFDIQLTGTSITFLAGTKSLTGSLMQSLILAFIFIAIIMVILFKSGRMLFICLIPNTVPLIVTAGIMGYWGIPLKPSTVLVFSVAYGIAVDTSIHFLAKFQQEIKRHNWDTQKTILVALKETGRSMIYNSLILFCGFITFTGSDFGGTVALGILTSITLIVAMLTNTMLLPSLLLTIEGSIKKSGTKQEAKRLAKLRKV